MRTKLAIAAAVTGLALSGWASSASAHHAFAAEFDPQPFHLDEAAAERSVFGGLAASGWHTAAISMRLIVLSGIRLAGGAVGLGGELSWPRPTRPGDTLHVETEVLDVRPSRSKPSQGIVTLCHTTFNQNREPVYIFTCKVLAFRRPVADPETAS